MEEAERLADRIVVMARGEVVAEGTPATLGGRDRAAGDRDLLAAARRAGRARRPGATLDERGRVTVRTRAAADDLHALTALGARRTACELADLEVRRPTLEDVYLELTR